MIHASRVLGALGLIGLLTWGAGVVRAGDLVPPAGVVAPTMKNLDDVEPRRVLRNNPDGVTPIVISEPGSYRLGEDIQGLGGQHGIEIDASDVTLDLNGFTIRGDLEIGSLDGIHVTVDPGPDERVNVTILNGTVREFGRHGVNAAMAHNSRISAVHSFKNGLGAFGGIGIWIGEGSIILECTVQLTSDGGGAINGQGISATHACTIVRCTAVDNDDQGIACGVSGVITGCTARSNGDIGFGCGNASVISDCASKDNAGVGFDVGQRCVMRGCTADGNGGHGIDAFFACTISDCNASANAGDGILASNSLIRGCLARGNSGTNINAIGGSTAIENH